MSDMTETTAPRTRLVWKTKEIKRTAASLTAYAILGVLGAAGVYALMLGVYVVGTALGAH